MAVRCIRAGGHAGVPLLHGDACPRRNAKLCEQKLGFAPAQQVGVLAIGGRSAVKRGTVSCRLVRGTDEPLQLALAEFMSRFRVTASDLSLFMFPDGSGF